MQFEGIQNGVTAAYDPGRITAIPYSRLGTSLRSLPIILLIHLHLLSLASTFATVFTQLPYVDLWGRTQAYVPLHYYRFFINRIRFAHGSTSWRFYPFFGHSTQCSQQCRILLSERDIYAILLRSTKRWLIHHSIEPDGCQVEIRDQLAHKARHRQWRWWLSAVQNSTIGPSQQQKSHTIHPDEFKTTTGHRRNPVCTPEQVNSQRKPRELRDQFEHKAHHRHYRRWSQVQDMINWARSTAEAPTTDGVTLPLNAAVLIIKAKSDYLQVSTITITFRPIEWSAPIPACVYTCCISNLAEVDLRRHGTTTYIWYTTWAKNTYGRGSVYDWSTLTATNICRSNWTYSCNTLRSLKCIYGQRPTQSCRPPTTTTTTGTTMTMMTSEHKYYAQSNRQSTHQEPTSFRYSASKN